MVNSSCRDFIRLEFDHPIFIYPLQYLLPRMELKVVISDPDTGKAYQQELKDEKAVKFKGKKVGEEVSGSLLGLEGYTLKVTGGSDKCGFPIKPGVHGAVRPKVLMEGGIGYNPKRKVRRKKRVRGERIDEDIVQVNTKVLKKGRMGIEELLGIGTDEKAEEPAEAEVEPPEKAEKVVKAEEKPEEAKPEEKPTEKPAEDKPAEKPAEEKAEQPAEPKPDEKAEESKPEAEPKPEESKPAEKPAETKAEEPSREER